MHSASAEAARQLGRSEHVVYIVAVHEHAPR